MLQEGFEILHEQSAKRGILRQVVAKNRLDPKQPIHDGGRVAASGVNA
jgi:hypothetical protein